MTSINKITGHIQMNRSIIHMCISTHREQYSVVLPYPLGTGSDVHSSLFLHLTKIHSIFPVFPEHLPHVAKNSCTIVSVLVLVLENLASLLRIKKLKDMDCVLLFLCLP